jgi:acetyl-CoA carboxylase biotin carboxyl carrier protein
VGTFYRSASPDSPPFVEEGDVIEKGKTLCILGAMKVMNELEAEFTMEIVAIKVPNGDMVEYGTPLLEVRRV